MTTSAITQHLAEELAQKIRDAARRSASEQELVVAVESALGPVLEQLGIPTAAEYEKTLLRGRADAVYGSVIIEYERPGKLATAPGLEEALGQARDYMRQQAEIHSPGSPEQALPKLVGVVLDGHQIGFVLWRPGGEPSADLFELRSRETQLSMDVEEEIAGRFQQLGPFAVSADAVLDLLRFLRALSRRPLEAGALASEFGPESATARTVVAALDRALREPRSVRTTVLYTEWLRLFGAIYGEAGKVKRPAVQALAETYDVPDDDIGRMLFAVHTYFALVMKILAIELVALQSGAIIDPLVAGLANESDSEFERHFAELESGASFRARGIENFLEGDFLGWYAGEWTDELRDAVRELTRELSDFEPGTASLRPELTQDLLKELYHRLLPRELRHALGEYYTPDWLAEYTLDRGDYRGQPGTRMLDPACGSGTFLVAAIRRMRDAALALGLSGEQAASAVTEGIVGFDLNPLAVIAARTNYLLACGDLVGAITPFVIPVYICDSISVPGQSVRAGSELQGKRLNTSVGEFFIPDAATVPGVLPRLMSELEFCAENEYPVEQFVSRARKLLPDAEAGDLEALAQLFEQIAKLRERESDGIWPRLLSNAFAPLFATGGFDYVIGNPPWIGWEEVSPEYREQTKPLWHSYNLFSLSGSAGRLGGGKKDMSMLMTYVAAEEYLKPHGRLTFLITQTVLQTGGAGEGFRSFHTGRRGLAVHSADDLANFKPFEDAANWTAIISLERDAETRYPVPYRLWNRMTGARLPRNASLSQALAVTERADLEARPVRRRSAKSPWLIGEAGALAVANAMAGGSPYRAKAGITVWLDGVFQVQVLGRRADGLVRICNFADVGKTQLDLVEAAIEPDLLYPYVPWTGLGRWCARPDRHLLVPQDPETRLPYPLHTLRERWPNTYAYLKQFEGQLVLRSGYRRYFKDTDPFYAIYNVSTETMAPRKIAWRTMGKDMQATVVGESALGETIAEVKPTVFKNTVIFLSVESEEEAHYLAGALNCTWTNWLLRACNVRGGKSAFATNLLGTIAIPAFSARSSTARDLARLAAQAAGEAADGEQEDLIHTEVLIDQVAARLWDIGPRGQEAIHASLAALG
jgi:Eco57I restriction-modification methylase